MIIRVCDLETTGLAPPETPCEVGWVDLAGEGDMWSVVMPSAREMLCNPLRPIPPETSAIHHIVNEDVEGAPFWPVALAECADKDGKMFRPDYLCAHNSRFEQLWFTDEITGGAKWICTFKCALRLWPDAPSHSNQALRYWLDPVGLDRAIASRSHRALPDAYVTAFLLREMLREATVEQLVAWTREPALLTKIAFGKHRGKRWAEVDAGFLRWILTKDFDEDVLLTARAELARRETADAAP